MCYVCTMAKTTQVMWTDDESFAIDKGCAKLSSLVGRPITRPELLKTLVRAWGAGLTVEELVSTAARDTQPPTEVR
ncbi:MAG TPA: hypothetical protein VMT97_09865 [Terriglobales bacterium]|nr:hypothetical protein [Terriglobales bacterium]